MKKIIACIIVYLLMVVFMFTAIKLNAAEIVDNEPTQEEVVNPDVDNVTPPVDNTPTTDDNTQEEVDKVPTIVEEKTKEITDYVIALVVAFLGSSTFYAIVKVLTKKGINALTNKVAALKEQNEISANAKIEYENKIAELEKQLNQATDKMDVVLGQITNYLEVDANKQKQMAELLEKLLPPLTIKDSDIKEGE